MDPGSVFGELPLQGASGSTGILSRKLCISCPLVAMRKKAPALWFISQTRRWRFYVTTDATVIPANQSPAALLLHCQADLSDGVCVRVCVGSLFLLSSTSLTLSYITLPSLRIHPHSLPPPVVQPSSFPMSHVTNLSRLPPLPGDQSHPHRGTLHAHAEHSSARSAIITLRVQRREQEQENKREDERSHGERLRGGQTERKTFNQQQKKKQEEGSAETRRGRFSLNEGRALGVVSSLPRWSDARNEGGW